MFKDCRIQERHDPNSLAKRNPNIQIKVSRTIGFLFWQTDWDVNGSKRVSGTDWGGSWCSFSFLRLSFSSFCTVLFHDAFEWTGLQFVLQITIFSRWTRRTLIKTQRVHEENMTEHYSQFNPEKTQQQLSSGLLKWIKWIWILFVDFGRQKLTAAKKWFSYNCLVFLLCWWPLHTNTNTLKTGGTQELITILIQTVINSTFYFV